MSTNGSDDVPGNLDHRPRSNTAKRNKTYGFNAESELLEFLRDKGFGDVERLVLAGTEDEGDLVIEGGTGFDTLVQLKTFAPRTQKGADRQLTPGTISKWLKAQEEQRANYVAHRNLEYTPAMMLIVKIKGMSWEQAFVIQSLKEVVSDA